MTVDERIEALKTKHTKIDNEIHEEAHRPLPDNVHLAELKREKLRIKDEISRMSDTH
jgi:hypothetical protein